MTSILLALALVIANQNDPAIDGRTLFALFEKYHSTFRDVTFLHEGMTAQTARTAGKDPEPANLYRFQGLYAYRSDGATLLDVFGLARGDIPENRTIAALLHNRLELLDASPDRLPPVPVRDRVPETGPGGPGSLGRQDSPERIFFAYYYPTLGDPAEHDLEIQGWEDVGGHRCLRFRMLNQPRSLLKGWAGALPFVRLWIDLERDGCPLRFEYSRGEDLEVRTLISRLKRLILPDGRAIWFPVTGRTTHYVGQDDQGRLVHTKEPVYAEDHWVLVDTVRFDQGLSDSFFSVKKHALVANNESLRKLQRELDKKPISNVKKPPADPESRQKQLDEALEEADRQATRLEASSAARAGAGWFEVLTKGLGVFGIVLLGGVGFWFRRTR